MILSELFTKKCLLNISLVREVLFSATYTFINKVYTLATLLKVIQPLYVNNALIHYCEMELFSIF